MSLAWALTAATASGAQGGFQLDLPLECTLGETCFIQQYVDADPGPGAADFTGGPLAYDGHRGTDFRVADLEALAAGVPILAPAPGVIRGIRDEMPDRLLEDRRDVEGRECGNGVAIDHGDGWETQLCHLALGSITVQTGQTVEAGDVVGEMGLSGATQFPHVHISVRKDGAVLDPFVEDLWQERPDYEPGGLLSVGFSDAVPSFDAVKAGTADAAELPRLSNALVVWASLFGGQAGDEVTLQIFDPTGAQIFDHVAVLERTQAQLFRAAGRRTPPTGWRPGTYRGQAQLIRDGQILDTLETRLPIR
ncbi:MAG: M23 family metallopeptidase [Pseudomonadota bacterium]